MECFGQWEEGNDQYKTNFSSEICFWNKILVDYSASRIFSIELFYEISDYRRKLSTFLFFEDFISSQIPCSKFAKY